jgi:pilus assembly protein Flp/PilA
MKLLKRLYSEEEGVTLIEYALLAGLIALALVTILRTTGETLNAFFEVLETELRIAGGS